VSHDPLNLDCRQAAARTFVQPEFNLVSGGDWIA